MIDVTIMNTTIQTIRAVARRPMDVIYLVLVSELCIPTVSVAILSKLSVPCFSVVYKLMFSVGSKLYDSGLSVGL